MNKQTTEQINEQPIYNIRIVAWLAACTSRPTSAGLRYWEAWGLLNWMSKKGCRIIYLCPFVILLYGYVLLRFKVNKQIFCVWLDAPSGGRPGAWAPWAPLNPALA
jgi:hypothetical protein